MLTINLSNKLRTGRFVMLAMLALLHAVLLVGVKSPWASPLMLAHLGLFLIWQPLWQGEGTLSLRALSLIVILSVVMLLYLNWWVISFWLIGLFGLVGSSVLGVRSMWARVFSVTQMIYLLALLLFWVVPNLFAAQPSMEIGRFLITYILPFFLPLMLLMPLEERSIESKQTIDFFYSLLLFMLLALVVLGSLAFMTLNHLDYLEALLRTLFLMGLVLVSLSLLWNPIFGFNGLQIVFSRYLLNIGTPFENWLSRLADVAQNAQDAESYLNAAMKLLSELHWLSGVAWQTKSTHGQIGESSKYAELLNEGPLNLTLYTGKALSPTVSMHIRLLSQLVGYFYQAKQREQRLRDMTRMQAVYETGSRLTHDLKNMMQSLYSLTAISQGNEMRAQKMMKEQLPVLTRRIEQTLGKLNQPQMDSNDAALMSLNAWWDSLRQRNLHLNIEWHCDDMSDRLVPSSMFDCVLDNLLDNALNKRQQNANITISVSLPTAEKFSILVCDSGKPVPENHMSALLNNVVSSHQGLGVGLYQAAKWAEQLGYRIRLANNENGRVCFELQQVDNQR